jgi:hypothetical protein
MLQLFCVVYRTGGTENLQWHRTLPTSDGSEAETRDATLRSGYRAYVVDYYQSLAIGLPETFE